MAGVTGRSGGHNARTVAQLDLSGTRRRDRHSGFASPEAPAGRPTPPKKLTGETRAEWQRMCDRLEVTGALSSIDSAAIYQYCRLFAETEALIAVQAEIEATAQKLKAVLPSLVGPDVAACACEIAKLLKIRSGYGVQIRQGRLAQRVYLVEFGLTPASRGRVKLPEPQDPGDPFAEFHTTSTRPPS